MLKNLSIFARLILLTGLMIFALLVIVWIGWQGFHIATKGIDEVYHGSVEEISNLTDLRLLYSINIVDSLNKVRDDLMKWNEADIQIKDTLSKITSILSLYLKRVESNKDGLQLNEKLKSQVINANNVLEKVFPIIELQDKAALSAFITKDLYQATDPVKLTASQLIKNFVELTQQDYLNSIATIAYYRKLMIVVFILALLLSLVMAYLITSSITNPLNQTIDTIKKVCLGDLSIETSHENSSKNEIGSLTNAIHNMVATDKKIVETLSKLQEGDLRVTLEPRSNKDALNLAVMSMTQRLREIIGSIQSEVVTLTNSSQEIINSVSQVAVSSTETATAVTETTTTVEELKQTAQVSADKANDVLARAEETLRIVKESEKSLQSTIFDMNQINEKMRTISEGIIKLSELSQTIGEIIDSVNDLAEQSNLLAVNAAIEAAKAGEQGKGFGVVAQEIRTLAEQSKTATVQVRAILNDIQNATSAAVLATEQGSKAVEKGVNQSSQTNESMRTLVSSMGYVTQSANQIAISSQQQLVGVDQVNMAMNNINEASRQHIENMKTIENAIGAFNLIGQTLKEITDQYILKDSQK